MTVHRHLVALVGLLALLAPAALAAPGCGGQAFQPQFPESQDPEITLSLRALAGPTPLEERPVIVGARADALFAFDPVSKEMLWEKETELASAPVVAGHFVVAVEGDRIVGRRIADGEVRFRLEPGQRLVGAHGDGEWVVISAATGPEESPRGVIALVQDDDVRWTEELTLPVGRAALVGNRIVVPWATQRVSILDARSGNELARFRMTDSVVGHALLADDDVYVGQHGLLRVQEGIERGTKESAPYFEPRGRPLPGQPPLLRDGYEPVPGPQAAPHRLRLAWRPVSEDGEVRLQNDALYFVFYRLVFAFDANEDQVRWVHVHPADVVGVEVHPQGPVVVDAQGNVVALDPESGLPRWRMEMGARATVAHLRLGRGELEGQAVEGGEAAPLPDQLIAAATVDDARLAGGRALAARYLGRHEGAEVTEQLIDLCADRDLSESIRLAACEQVGTRTEGVEHVRQALAAKASFLEGTSAPPVGPLATAAASMNARNQVPVLIRHLEDPATPNEDLPALFDALVTLEARNAARPIEAFFRLHHAEQGDAALTRAVVAAGRALRALQEDRATPLLRAAVEDPLASQTVREGVATVLSEPTPSERAAAEAAADAEAEASAEARSQAEADDRPARIDARMTAQVFAPVEAQLRGCLTEDIGRARIRMSVSPEGLIERVVVQPTLLQQCIEGIVRGRQYPETRAGRQQVSYVVSAESAEAEEESSGAAESPARRRRARGARRGGEMAGSGESRATSMD